MKSEKRQDEITRSEIEEIIRENNALKLLLDKTIKADDSQEVPDSLGKDFLQKYKLMLHINEYVSELASMPFSENLFQVIAEQLREITGSVLTLVTLFDSATSNLVVRGASLSAQDSSILEKIIGKTALGMKFYLSDDNIATIKDLPYIETSSLKELSFNQLPSSIARAIETTFSLDWMVGFILTENDKILGSLVFVGKKGSARYSVSDLIGFKSVTKVAISRWLLEKKRLDNENKYKFIVENSKDIIWTLDLNLNFTYISPSFIKLLGYTEKELYNLTIDKIVSKEHLPHIIEIFHKAMERERTDNPDINIIETFEHDDITKDGRLISFETRCSFLRDEYLNPIGIIGASRDLTERKAAEKEISYKNSIINSLFLNLPFDFWVRDTEQRLILSNMESRTKWGYEIGSTPDSATDVLPEIVKVWKSNNERVLKGETIKEESVFDGKYIYQIVSPLYDEKSDIIGFGGINIDITETKIAEKKLRESELSLKQNNELLNHLLDNLHIGVFMVEAPTGKPLIANPEATRLLGRGILPDANKDNLSEVYNAHKPNSTEPYPPEQMPILRGMHGETSHIDDMIVERPDGGQTWLEVFGAPVRNEQGEVWASIVSFQDITERKQAEARLKESEEYLRITLNSIGDGVISTDIHGLVVQMNPVAERLTGWNLSDAIGKPLNEVFYIINAQTREIVENPVARVIKTGRIIGLANHTILLSRNGEEVQIADSAAPIKDKNGVIHGVVLVFVDVTKDYAVRKELQDSQIRLERAELCAEFGHWEFNLNNGSVTSSIGARTIYGIGDDELTIQDSIGYAIEEDRNRIKELLKKVSETGESDTIIFRIIRQIDSAVRVIHSTVEYDKPRNIVFGVIQDITERTEAQEALVQNEARYRQIVENITIAVVIHQDDKIVYVNKEALKLLGANEQTEIISKSIIEFVHESDREKVFKLIEKITPNPEQEQLVIEERLVRQDGSIISVEASAILIDYNNKPAYMIWLKDVTERKESIEQLRTSEEKFRSLAENTSDVIIRFDKFYRICYINSASSFILGLNPSAVTNKRITELSLFDEEQEKLFSSTIDTVFHKAQSNRIQFEFNFGDNTLYLDWFITPEFDANGNVASVISISRDITEIKLIQSELEKAREKAEESDRLKSILLANLSQELRNPMNSILGFAGLLYSDSITQEERIDYAKVIYESGHKLTELINNIIDISLIETEQMPLNQYEFNLNKLLLDVYEKYMPQAKSKSINMSVSYGLSDNDSLVFSDGEKIAKILINLLSNAIKFTEKGRIDFGYTVVGKYIYFFVKDTGIGIEPELINYHFSKTSQLNYSIENEQKISGLGLHLCKGLVELMQGAIGVEPQKETGTKFYFKIPYHKSELDTKKEVADKIVDTNLLNMNKKRKILIAEDDNISYLLLKNLLKKDGDYEFYHALNGNEAVQLAKDNPDIEFVFMDLKMPELNGFDATRIIKSMRPELPIIAITALAMLGDKEKVLEAGCNDYISKPYNPKDVIDKMKRLLAK